MQRGQMMALLGVLAVAGYQNRDKIADALKQLTQGGQAAPDGGTAAAPGAQSDGLGGLLGSLTQGGGFGNLLKGGSAGGILSGGLGDLLEQFQQNGQGEAADSWVSTGPNKEIDGGQLSQALGPDVLQELAAKTGLSQDEILGRLTRDLPKAVDDLTPNGFFSGRSG